MERPEYTVTELQDNHSLTPSADVGDPNVSGRINDLLDRFTALGKRRFRVTWKGSNRVPQTTVGSLQIGWTQHGVVRDPSGKPIGTYERIKDTSGPNSDENEMLIALFE